MPKTERQYFTILLQVDSWNWSMSHIPHRAHKDYPEPPILESFRAKGKVLYSDQTKYPACSYLNIWVSPDYEYMVYHLKKGFKFADDEKPDQPFASISYDEHIARVEKQSKQIVGTIRQGQVSLSIPTEVASRIAIYRDSTLYIGVRAHKEKGGHRLLIDSINIASTSNLDDYQ